MPLRDEDVLCWMSKNSLIGPEKICKIMSLVKSPMDIVSFSYEEKAELFGERAAAEFEKEIEDFSASEYRNELLEKNIDLITIYDSRYPELLKEIHDPPYVLYFRGNIDLLKNGPIIGVVGSRTPSVYGREYAEYFCRELVKEGITIASGMARGIDSVAHIETLKSGGNTVAVLGCGVNICYPERNFKLYEEMGEKMLIISEQPPDTPPFIYNFPLRNRIISGISKGILVIEAREKSGTLITADAALEQNRYIYAIPGRLSDPMSRGTNMLISEGRAALALSPDIILYDVLGKVKGKKKSRTKTLNLTELEKRILSHISTEPVFAPDLSETLEIRMGELLSILIKLEKMGVIKQIERGYYIQVGLHP